MMSGCPRVSRDREEAAGHFLTVPRYKNPAQSVDALKPGKLRRNG
jgi:hypothetical protein